MNLLRSSLKLLFAVQGGFIVAVLVTLMVGLFREKTREVRVQLKHEEVREIVRYLKDNGFDRVELGPDHRGFYVRVG